MEEVEELGLIVEVREGERDMEGLRVTDKDAV